MQSEWKRKATETVKLLGLDEQGLMIVRGLATTRAREFDEYVGGLIPGAGAFVNKSRRLLLVTDRHVYLLEGHRHDRPGKQLGAYPIGPDVISFDGDKITFPDGQFVFVTDYQAQLASHYVGADYGARTASSILERAGITEEQGITYAEVTIGSGVTLHASVVVVVAQEHVYVVNGTVSSPGDIRETYPVTERLSVVGRDLIFPDGGSLRFSFEQTAEHIAETARRIASQDSGSTDLAH